MASFDINQHRREESRQIAEKFMADLDQFLWVHGLDTMDRGEAISDTRLMKAMSVWIAMGRPTEVQ